MTPNSISQATVLGNIFGGHQVVDVEEFFAKRQQSFDPKSLQERKTEDSFLRESSKISHRLPEFFEVGEVQKLARTRSAVRPNATELAALPAETILSESARQSIGENGLTRLREFSKYESGWDLGQGKSLALRSVVILSAFMTQLPELAQRRPSLFMTHEGNLELGLEDGNGRSISIEFYPDKIDYYLEGLGDEQTVKLDLIPQLIDKVRSLIS